MSRAQTASLAFLARLEFGMRRCDAVGKNVVIGVSGGADSVALLRGLLLLREPLGLSLSAAHLNHQLRGRAADADAEWVEFLCERLGLPCDVTSVPVAERAEELRRGVEEVARETRYEFLQSVAQRRGCDAIAVAHTADDQAETVLHHVLRGTSLSGLRGMKWSRGAFGCGSDFETRIIRPMLGIWRRDVEEFLAGLTQDFRKDETNADTSLTRNRLRREVLPLLERDVNPQVREHLCELAEQAADWEVALRAVADEWLCRVLLDRSPSAARIRCDDCAEQSRHIVREAFVRLWHLQNWPRQFMTFKHWDTLAAMAQTGEPASCNLPGDLSARRRGGLLAVECPAPRFDGRADGS